MLFKLDLKGEPRGHVFGVHKRFTPAILCPKCGWRQALSPHLPLVEIGDLPLPGKPVRPEEFQMVVDQLQPLYPRGFPVQQQQGLGQLTNAEWRGHLDEVAILIGSGPSCFRLDCYEALRTCGISQFAGTPIRFRRRGRYSDQYIEVQVNGLVSMGAAMHPTGQLAVCSICGNTNVNVLDSNRLTIKRASIPDHGDLFGVKEWGDIRIVTERFRDCAAAFLPHADFRPIPIVNE